MSSGTVVPLIDEGIQQLKFGLLMLGDLQIAGASDAAFDTFLKRWFAWEWLPDAAAFARNWLLNLRKTTIRLDAKYPSVVEEVCEKLQQLLARHREAAGRNSFDTTEWSTKGLCREVYQEVLASRFRGNLEARWDSRAPAIEKVDFSRWTKIVQMWSVAGQIRLDLLTEQDNSTVDPSLDTRLVRAGRRLQSRLAARIRALRWLLFRDPDEGSLLKDLDTFLTELTNRSSAAPAAHGLFDANVPESIRHGTFAAAWDESPDGWMPKVLVDSATIFHGTNPIILLQGMNERIAALPARETPRPLLERDASAGQGSEVLARQLALWAFVAEIDPLRPNPKQWSELRELWTEQRLQFEVRLKCDDEDRGRLQENIDGDLIERHFDLEVEEGSGGYRACGLIVRQHANELWKVLKPIETRHSSRLAEFVRWGRQLAETCRVEKIALAPIYVDCWTRIEKKLRDAVTGRRSKVDDLPSWWENATKTDRLEFWLLVQTVHGLQSRDSTKTLAEAVLTWLQSDDGRCEFKEAPESFPPENFERVDYWFMIPDTVAPRRASESPTSPSARIPVCSRGLLMKGPGDTEFRAPVVWVTVPADKRDSLWRTLFEGLFGLLAATDANNDLAWRPAYRDFVLAITQQRGLLTQEYGLELLNVLYSGFRDSQKANRSQELAAYRACLKPLYDFLTDPAVRFTFRPMLNAMIEFGSLIDNGVLPDCTPPDGVKIHYHKSKSKQFGDIIEISRFSRPDEAATWTVSCGNHNPDDVSRWTQLQSPPAFGRSTTVVNALNEYRYRVLAQMKKPATGSEAVDYGIELKELLLRHDPNLAWYSTLIDEALSGSSDVAKEWLELFASAKIAIHPQIVMTTKPPHFVWVSNAPSADLRDVCWEYSTERLNQVTGWTLFAFQAKDAKCHVSLGVSIENCRAIGVIEDLAYLADKRAGEWKEKVFTSQRLKLLKCWSIDHLRGLKSPPPLNELHGLLNDFIMMHHKLRDADGPDEEMALKCLREWARHASAVILPEGWSFSSPGSLHELDADRERVLFDHDRAVGEVRICEFAVRADTGRKEGIAEIERFVGQEPVGYSSLVETLSSPSAGATFAKHLDWLRELPKHAATMERGSSEWYNLGIQFYHLFFELCESWDQEQMKHRQPEVIGKVKDFLRAGFDLDLRVPQESQIFEQWVTRRIGQNQRRITAVLSPALFSRPEGSGYEERASLCKSRAVIDTD